MGIKEKRAVARKTLSDASSNPEIQVRELKRHEFPLAEEIWLDYHQTKGNPEHDRIFGVFITGELVSVARCKRHTDGLEVDGIFTPERFRGHGYAKLVVSALVEACHHDVLYMHSVLNLVKFYGEFGFVEIDEDRLPTTIRERFDWAMGEMEGSNVQPMMRSATPRYLNEDEEKMGKSRER
jgi:GNAT superfamily N-acetyltransferase